MIVWVDGAPVYGYGRELTEIPPTRLGRHGHRRPHLPDARSPAGVGACSCADGDAKAHLEWHGLSPATHYGGHPHGPLPQAVAWGHYEQTCRVTGDLHVGGQHDRVRRLRPARPLVGLPPLGRARPVALGHRLPRRRPGLQPLRGPRATTARRRSTATSTGPTATSTSWRRPASWTASDDGGAERYRVLLAAGRRLGPRGHRRAGRLLHPGAPGRRPARHRARDADAPRAPTASTATASTSTSSPSAVEPRGLDDASPTGRAADARPGG